VTSTVPILAPELAKAVAAQRDRLDLDVLSRAYRISAQAHQGQKRLSGDDFVSHSVAVATILAEQQMDTTTIAAALLHDVVEDSDVTLELLRKDFGNEVADLVDGLTKISTLNFRSTAEEQAENYRKLLMSVARDARVIIIKLADRLHNMRTLDPLPPEKRKRIALETRELYAPLAHRFGMAGVKAELEDLSFKYLEPDDYKQLARQVKARRVERDRTIERMRAPLADELRRAGIVGWEIVGRPKNLWSIFKKMKKRGKPFEEIYDLLAVRVLVNSITDCYHVLGIIHHTWTPLQERIKDYIASPKSNGYQSLHTTVFGPAGQLYEIQIRTRDMHRTAEYGIAAHWLYKENGKGADELDHHLSWFRQLIELQQDAHTPEEFLEFLKIDLYQDEIFVFTPRGDVKRLPKGATPIDFAFMVHTEVGQHCNGARVNGRIAPLHRPLRNGDTIEVLTSAQAKPSRDWLAHVQTGRARQKIRQWIKQEEQERARGPAPPARSAHFGAARPSGVQAIARRGRAGGSGDWERRRPTRAGHEGALSRVAHRGEPARQADGVRARDRAAAPGPWHQDSWRRGPHGPLCAMLPACAWRPRRWLCDTRTRDLGSSDRLPESPHPLWRRGAAGRDRLAGGGGTDVRGAARRERRGPPGSLRRHLRSDQWHGHQHPQCRARLQGRHRIRVDPGRGRESHPPAQGLEGGPQGEGCDGDCAAGLERSR